MKKSEIFTLSNIISFIRIFLAFPIYYYISIYDNTTAFALIILGIITDGLDGYFARKWDQITDLGKIIDPLADKICIGSGFLALSIYQGLPVWITVIIIARDLIIIVASLFVLSYKKVVMPSNRPGKLTVMMISMLGIVYLINFDFLKLPFIILTSISILYSLINYAVEFFKSMAKKNES